MTNKFKVGDKIRVRKDLKYDKKYKDKKPEDKNLGGFIINNDNALQVIHEIQEIFDKHKLSMVEITHIVDVLANATKQTNKFKDDLTSMEASKVVLGIMMQDKQLKEDL